MRWNHFLCRLCISAAVVCAYLRIPIGISDHWPSCALLKRHVLVAEFFWHWPLAKNCQGSRLVQIWQFRVIVNRNSTMTVKIKIRISVCKSTLDRSKPRYYNLWPNCESESSVSVLYVMLITELHSRFVCSCLSNVSSCLWRKIAPCYPSLHVALKEQGETLSFGGASTFCMRNWPVREKKENCTDGSVFSVNQSFRQSLCQRTWRNGCIWEKMISRTMPFYTMLPLQRQSSLLWLLFCEMPEKSHCFFLPWLGSNHLSTCSCCTGWALWSSVGWRHAAFANSPWGLGWRFS